jgi:hypothetical protein
MPLMFEAMTAKMIELWNKNHIARLEHLLGWRAVPRIHYCRGFSESQHTAKGAANAVDPHVELMDALCAHEALPASYEEGERRARRTTHTAIEALRLAMDFLSCQATQTVVLPLLTREACRGGKRPDVGAYYINADKVSEMFHHR